MGSSTASETTINTSTDSSNTIVTTMTATDGDNTEDSLDLNEPLDYLNSENIVDAKHPNVILQPIPVTPKTPLTAKQQTPPTAKEKESKFLFDVEASVVASKDSPKNLPDHKQHHHSNCREEKSVDVFMEEQIEALKIDAKRRNSYKAAQDGFDKIEVFNDKEEVRHTNSPKERRAYQRKEYENGRIERCIDSPDFGNDILSPKLKHRQKKSSRKHHSPSKRDKFIYDEKYIAKYREKARMTPPLPDLRVDFFNETVDNCQGDSLLVPISGEKRGSVCLNKCIREVGAQLEQSATSPINVTTNPLENSVHFGGRKVPQATIVVQQPSLSLDQSNVSTILLKNGSEFVSNVESAGNKLSLKKQKEENMKQLLDVANNLTLEEIHDFEMR